MMEKFLHPEEEFSAKGGLIRYKVLNNYKHQITAMFNKETRKQKKIMPEKLQEMLPERFQEVLQDFISSH